MIKLGNIAILLMFLGIILISISVLAYWVEDTDTDGSIYCPSTIKVWAEVKGDDVGTYFSSVSHSFNTGSTSGCGYTCVYNDPVFKEYLNSQYQVVKAETIQSGNVYDGPIPIEYIEAHATIRA